MSALKSVASGALRIIPFDGYELPYESTESALMRAFTMINPGEVIRLYIDRNPHTVIIKLALKYGSKLIFQYLQNRDGGVIIDFKKVCM